MLKKNSSSLVILTVLFLDVFRERAPPQTSSGGHPTHRNLRKHSARKALCRKRKHFTLPAPWSTRQKTCLICTKVADGIIAISGSLKELGQKVRTRRCTQAITSTVVVDMGAQRLLKEHLASLRDMGAYRQSF